MNEGQPAYKIGVDIGGTKVNLLFLSEQGELLLQRTIPTERDVRRIAAFVKKQADAFSGTPVSIGVGVPGTVDREKGSVIYAPNLDWRGVGVKRAFAAYFDLPLAIGQDTEAAAVGEYLFGAGQGMENLICLTIGTGVGCGLIIGGRDYKGKYLCAGEFGHMVAVPGGRLCGCGKRGCVEAYASGTGMRGLFLDAYHAGRLSLPPGKTAAQVTTRDLFAGARAGNEVCRQLVAQAVEVLASAITSAVNLLGPDGVILSGGLAAERELLIEPVFACVYDQVYEVTRDHLLLDTAKLGADAPAYGAAFFDAICR